MRFRVPVVAFWDMAPWKSRRSSLCSRDAYCPHHEGSELCVALIAPVLEAVCKFKMPFNFYESILQCPRSLSCAAYLTVSRKC